MTLEDRISAFVKLGNHLDTLSSEDLALLSQRAKSENQWFTEENIQRAITGIRAFLVAEKLKSWTGCYKLDMEIPKIVGIVMAGNIPLVGFHDLLCVLLSGHFAAVKLSSQDASLSRLMIQWLLEIEPRFRKSIEVRERLTEIDAVISTGSDNTSRYFEYYFRDIPRIIRKNRTSIAVLDGTETNRELADLGKDIFWYYGLGCRNVSKLLVPTGYDPRSFYESIEHFKEVGHHNKYKNNYEYYRSIFLVNGTPHLDNGFLIWLPTTELVSPVSVIYVEEYHNQEDVTRYLETHKEKLQCMVGHDYLPFGQAQSPEVWDYADHVDTMGFLVEL